MSRPFLILPRTLAVSLIRNAHRLSVLNVYTYHNYVGYGLDPKLAPKIMDPSGAFFDSGPGRAHAMIDGWHKFGEPNGMDLWVGEIAAAWHSGCAAHFPFLAHRR